MSAVKLQITTEHGLYEYVVIWIKT